MKISLPIKVLLVSGSLLVAYGYLCRMLDLYFFWESKYLGFSMLALGLIFLAFASSKRKKNKKNIPEITVIILSIMFLSLYLFFTAMVYFSSAYQVAKDFIYRDKELQVETGLIENVSLIPFGSYSWEWTNGQSEGYVILNLTVKGHRQYKDITVFLDVSTEKNAWEVIDLKPYRLVYSLPGILESLEEI